jgi:hypothetical protein
MLQHRWSNITVVLAFAACSSPPDADVDAGPPPTAFRAEGTAMGTEADERATCVFYAEITDVTASATGWVGTAAGEVFRRRVDAAGAPLFEFQALIGGAVTFTGGEVVEARLVGDQTDAMPFWSELEVLSGAEDPAFHYGGDWACAPILPDDGPEGDSPLTVPGTWTIVPVDL